LQYRPVTFLFALCTFISIIFLWQATSQELAPAEDDGAVALTGDGPLYANLEYLQRYTSKVEDIMKSIQERASNIIIDGAAGPNNFFGLILLKPWDQRERNSSEVKQHVMVELSKITGLRAFAFSIPSIPGTSSRSNMDLEFVITTLASEEVLYQVAEKVRAKMLQSRLFVYVNNELKFNKPELVLNIQRDKAAELGISMEQIGSALGILLNESESTWFSREERSYKVILQADRPFRYNPEELNDYYVRTDTDKLIPLSTFVSMEVLTKPNQLSQYQQLNAANLGAMLAPGVKLNKAMELLEKLVKEELPSGFQIDFQGQARRYMEEGNTWWFTLGLALLLIYLVLAAQFESFRDPLIVLMAVPLSICGAMIPLALGLASLNLFTKIGLVTLIGLISKHGILIVDFANRLQKEEGINKTEAVIKASAVRLRPILMTSAAIIFGVVPLLVASGAGAASRFNIGLVITSGMFLGTLFTLFVVPAFYSLLAQNHNIDNPE